MKRNNQRVTGFTLIELIVVIVILTIVGLGTARFVGLGADLYVDAVGRDQVVSQTRYALERLTREIREALPNSVRVVKNANDTVQCIEFVPIVASSTYVNVAVAPEAISDQVVIVRPPFDVTTASRVVVYPLSAADVYTPESDQGNIFSYTGTITGGTDTVNITLNSEVRFDADSPTARYYLVANAVSYCVNDITKQLMRYDNYWPELVPLVPTNAVAGVLMAENIDNQFQNQPENLPFSYSDATLVANAVVQLTFEVNRLGETVTFHHEVHLVNVP